MGKNEGDAMIYISNFDKKEAVAISLQHNSDFRTINQFIEPYPSKVFITAKLTLALWEDVFCSCYDSSNEKECKLVHF